MLDGLNEYELIALQYIYAKGRITVRELCTLLDRSVKVARPVLRGLVDKGVLAWHGSGPKGSFAALHAQVSSANVESASLDWLEWGRVSPSRFE